MGASLSSSSSKEIVFYLTTIGFGDYKKGELNVEGKKIDIHNKFYKFNGSLKTHFVEPWTSGDRYIIVYYNRTNW